MARTRGGKWLGRAILLFAVPAWGATLSAGSASVTPAMAGVPIAITLTPQSGDLVAAIQFDLAFDPRVAGLAEIRPGDAATAAGKSVSTNEVSPGHFRVIIAGLNQNAMGAGEVAVPHFNIAGAPPNGDHPLRLEDLVMANPNGRAVPATAEWGLLRVTGGVPDQPAPCCGCGVLRAGSRPAGGAMALLALAGALAYLSGWLAARPGRAGNACSRAWTSRVTKRFAGVGTPWASP